MCYRTLKKNFKFQITLIYPRCLSFVIKKLIDGKAELPVHLRDFSLLPSEIEYYEKSGKNFICGACTAKRRPSLRSIPPLRVTDAATSSASTKLAVNFLQQNTREKCIEIVRVPNVQNDNALDCAFKIFSVGMNVTEAHIDDCYVRTIKISRDSVAADGTLDISCVNFFVLSQ